VDGLTWQDYEADLDRNIEDLHDRVHRGAYRAQPSRRLYIPKPEPFEPRSPNAGAGHSADAVKKGGLTWARMTKLADDWLPKPRILHPWPNQRFAVRHPR
jgi:hypothetical protein